MCLLALGACTNPMPPEAYQIQSDPEKLITMASDIVTIDLSGKSYSERLSDTLELNPPTSAVLNCNPSESACKKAKRILSKHKIETESADSGNSVTLLYARLAVRECENRYIDNSHNPYNLQYSSYGCATASNMSQMVTDKRQFTNPELLDFHDGEKAAAVYDNYLNPPATTSSSAQSGSVAGSITSQIGAGGQ